LQQPTDSEGNRNFKIGQVPTNQAKFAVTCAMKDDLQDKYQKSPSLGHRVDLTILQLAGRKLSIPL
jgi:hypothetical protein